MFPGPHAHVYYNEAGEPEGWDYPAEPDYDPYEDDRRADAESAAAEDAYYYAQDEHGATDDEATLFAQYRVKHGKGKGLEEMWFQWTAAREAKLT